MSLVLRTLGRSGLVVSPLALGTMTFGADRWGAGETESRALFDAYLAAGGNFVDTADIYAGGRSEELLGSFIENAGVRDEIVLATKFGFNASASPLEASNGAPGNPHAGGAGAKNIHRALESSLRRLKTDHIDLYWMHVWDGVTPVEEVVQTLGNLVAQGKIRYYAFSDMPAWVAMKAATIASERRIAGPIAMQVELSLVARDVEREHLPVAKEAALGVVPWSPLAGGFLSGKYQRGQTATTGRLSGANPFGDSKFTERNWDILDVVREVAEEQGCTPGQVGLAWVLTRPSVDSVLIGARNTDQLAANLATAELELTTKQRQRLDEVSAPEVGFSDGLTAPGLRKMLFGGHQVRGWNE